MLQDLRYCLRLLLRHPGFTLTAISVLALGIGVNAGIFGLINGLLRRPLPGAEAAGEIVGLYSHDRTTERGYRGFSEVREAGGPFAVLAAHNVTMVGISEGNTTRQSFADASARATSRRSASSRSSAAISRSRKPVRRGHPGHRRRAAGDRHWPRPSFRHGERRASRPAQPFEPPTKTEIQPQIRHRLVTDC